MRKEVLQEKNHFKVVQNYSIATIFVLNVKARCSWKNTLKILRNFNKNVIMKQSGPSMGSPGSPKIFSKFTIFRIALRVEPKKTPKTNVVSGPGHGNN